MLFKKNKKKEKRVFNLANKTAPFQYQEAYKSLRTNLDFISSTKNYKTYLITSPMPREGKTTLSLNLTYILANRNKKVVLIDCDLRKGTIGSYIRLWKNRLGLSSVLIGKEDYHNVIFPYAPAKDDYTVDIIPAGILPPNPSELIGSESMARLIQQLEEEYDYVILDAPPTNLVTDAAILSRVVDGVIIVARYNVTTKQELIQCQKSLNGVHANIVGVVFNDIEYKMKWNNRYSYKYGSYGE